MAQQAHISKEMFRFLRDLSKNNNRAWFQRNKERYEETVKEPLLEFISEFSPHLLRINRHLVADSRPVGGSLFRIYRDVRFSSDKSPYKTHAGVRFPHEDTKSVHAPGYYLHLEPGAVFAASGIWHPDPATLQKMREAIVDDPAGWKRARRFRGKCALGGESLKKAPKGFDPEHPLIEDLKRKDFVAYAPFTEAEACSGKFMKAFSDTCASMKGFLGFLSVAVGARW